MDCVRASTLFGVFVVAAATVTLCSGNCEAQSTDTSSAAHPPETATQAQLPLHQPVAAPIAANAPHMERQTRYEIIRDFETQLVYARTAFPMGTKGLQLKQGVITPNGEELQQTLNLWGPEVKPGDPAHISFVQIKDDHIHFEINGGPIRRKKWYQRVEISGASGVPVNSGSDQPIENPHGSFVDLCFDRYVPELTA